MFDLVKRHYFFTFDMRDTIRSKVSFRVGTIAVFAGAIAYLFRNYQFPTEPPLTWTDWIFASTLAVASAGAIASAILLAYVILHPKKYQRIGDIEDVVEHGRGLRDYYKAGGRSPRKVFKEDMLDKYAEAADRNRNNNMEKLKHVYRSGYGILWTLVFLLLSLPGYVVNGIESQENHSNSHQERKAAMPTPQKGTQKPRPKPPPNVETREDKGPDTSRPVHSSTPNDPTDNKDS